MARGWLGGRSDVWVQRFSIQFHGGVGAEYQLENRHYGIGIAVDGFLIPQFGEMKAIASRIYLRYTYGGG